MNWLNSIWAKLFERKCYQGDFYRVKARIKVGRETIKIRSKNYAEFIKVVVSNDPKRKRIV